MAASAARSAGFNAVVAARLRQSRWLEVKMGDAVALAGRGSHFMVSDSELESVRDRIVIGGLDPTAPMAGRQTKTSIEQAAFECSILRPIRTLCMDDWCFSARSDALSDYTKVVKAEVSG